MEREVFVARFREATAGARDFARRLIVEDLPDPLVFRLRLNGSYDGNPLVEDEQLFPEDGSFERASELSACDEALAIATLWRDGRVPEWIDVSAIGETGHATIVQLMCCGRFTARDHLLLHDSGGHPPFQVVGPVYPASGPIDDTYPRFSIYNTSECWSLAELERALAHAERVWSLRLIGRAFDDDALEAVVGLPNLESATLFRNSLEGRGLRSLAKLRHLEIELGQTDAFSIDELTAPGLKHLTLTAVPARDVGISRLLARSPRVEHLRIHAESELVLDAPCPQVSRIAIRAKRVRGTLVLGARLESIDLRVADMDDNQIARWLAPVAELRHLNLDGTRISDALAVVLADRYELRSLSLSNTDVRNAGLARIAKAHPDLQLSPRPA